MAALETPEIISLLREFGQQVALRGGNPYRGKAYARAAESLGTLTVPLAEVIRDGRLIMTPRFPTRVGQRSSPGRSTNSARSLRRRRRTLASRRNSTRKGHVRKRTGTIQRSATGRLVYVYICGEKDDAIRPGTSRANTCTSSRAGLQEA
jgi:Helix-hairpin-helix domain